MNPLYVPEWSSPETLDFRSWGWAGPVARAYEMSGEKTAMIVGPVGGGKSTASSRKTLRVATWQHPSPIDGVRKARICCVCPTYRKAWDQVMPTYFETFPQTLGTFRGSRGDPADHIYDTMVPINGEMAPVHVEVLFRAVREGEDIEAFVRGFQVTAWWFPEADTNPSDELISKAATRHGRYPTPDHRPEVDQQAFTAYSGVFGDANAPLIGSWFHERFYLKPRKGETLFRQPGGTSPKAENLGALRRINPNYYANKRLELDEYDAIRFIDCKPGYGRSGKAVHPNFDPSRHVASHALDVDPLLDVYIGVDAGSNALRPGATFSQRSYSGQWRKLAEIFVGKEAQMTTEELGAEIRRLMDTRFARAKGAQICIDPAAASRNAVTGFTTAQTLQAFTNIEVQLAPSNDPKHRRSVTNRLLKINVAAGEPAIVIDPGCTGLIAGYTGGFHYPKRGSDYAVLPKKDEYSNICEADEYAQLTIEGVGPDDGGFIRPGRESDYSAPKILAE